MLGTEATGGGAASSPDPVDDVRRWLTRHGVPEVDPAPGAPSAVTDAGPGLEAGAGSEDRAEVGLRTGRGSRARSSGSARSSGPSRPAPGDDPDADPVDVARRIVLRKLSVQARTRSELAKALRSKEVPDDTAAVVLDRMEEVGLVDDAGLARDWVDSRQQRRHLSRTALRRELQAKGVDRDQIDEALAPIGAPEEYEAAVSLARRRQRTMAALPRDVQYRRLAGVLGRRGFAGAVAARVLAEVVGVSADPADD